MTESNSPQATPLRCEWLERLTLELRAPAAARRAAGAQPGVKPRDSGAPRRARHPGGVPEGPPAALQAAGVGGGATDPGFHPGLGTWRPSRPPGIGFACATHQLGALGESPMGLNRRQKSTIQKLPMDPGTPGLFFGNGWFGRLGGGGPPGKPPPRSKDGRRHPVGRRCGRRGEALINLAAGLPVVSEVLGGLKPEVPQVSYPGGVKPDGSGVDARTRARNGGLELGSYDPRSRGALYSPSRVSRGGNMLIDPHPCRAQSPAPPSPTPDARGRPSRRSRVRPSGGPGSVNSRWRAA
jgi:hypothetical protein